MIKLLRRFYSDLKLDCKVYSYLIRRIPKKIYFLNILFTWIIVVLLSGVAFFEGDKMGFKTLSKIPQQSVIKLIVEKCQDSIENENYNKHIRYEKITSCMGKEFSLIRDQAVNVTIKSKFSRDIDECVARTENIEKCLIDIEPLNTKRQEAYKGFKALMEINGIVEVTK